jgi:hypothetical protein
MQFAFVDASHLFDLTLMEFVLLDKKLAVGGIIGLHDTWMPSLQKAVRFILANRAYEIVRGASDRSSESDPPRQRITRLLSRMARRVPGAKRIFRPELLNPWQNMKIENLILLRKTADDRRDWRFHKPF